MMGDLAQRKDALRAPWVAGDQGILARTLGVEAAEDFVAGLGEVTGRRVLDAACGSGGATLPLARRGARVAGLDIAPNLLAQARSAAEAAGLDIRLDEGFAEEMPYAEASFDLVTSMFGVMFSSFPDRIAAEFGRVLIPDGRIALANWTSNGLQGGIGQIINRYLPQPSTAQQKFNWSDETQMRGLLEPHFTGIEMRRVPIRWDFAGDPTDLVDLFMKNAGPFLMILDQLPEEKRSAFIDDHGELFARSNEAPAGSGRTWIKCEYLEVKATRRREAGGA